MVSTVRLRVSLGCVKCLATSKASRLLLRSRRFGALVRYGDKSDRAHALHRADGSAASRLVSCSCCRCLSRHSSAGATVGRIPGTGGQVLDLPNRTSLVLDDVYTAYDDMIEASDSCTAVGFSKVLSLALDGFLEAVDGIDDELESVINDDIDELAEEVSRVPSDRSSMPPGPLSIPSMRLRSSRTLRGGT